MLRKRKPYPSDLTDAQWALLQPLLPPPKARGRKRTVNLRAIVNAIFYVLHTGCQWDYRPHDCPPADTVYGYFRQWTQDGTWERLNAALRGQVRQAVGKDVEPTAGVLDSQSVKTTEAAAPPTRGYDAGKRVSGRKRHLLVDTLGLRLWVVVHPANVQDRDGARLVLAAVRERFPRLSLIWVDSGYAGPKLGDWVKAACHWVLEVVKRAAGTTGFEAQPHRWIVERTIAWLNRSRRLSQDYERLPATSEAFIRVAMIRLMLRQLARPAVA